MKLLLVVFAACFAGHTAAHEVSERELALNTDLLLSFYKLDPQQLATHLGLDASQIGATPDLDIDVLGLGTIIDETLGKIQGHYFILTHMKDIDVKNVDFPALAQDLGVDTDKLMKMTKENLMKLLNTNLDVSKVVAMLGLDGLDLSKLNPANLDYTKLKEFGHKVQNAIAAGLSKVNAGAHAVMDSAPKHCIVDSDCGANQCCAHLKKDKRSLQDLINKLKPYIQKGQDALHKGKDYLAGRAQALQQQLLRHGVCLAVQPRGGDCLTFASCGCGPGLQCKKVAHFLDALHLNYHGVCSSSETSQ